MHFLHHITSNVDFYCCFSHWLNLKNIFALNFSGTTLVSSLQFYQKVVDGFVVWCELIQLQLSIEKGDSSGLEKIEDSYHSCILYEGWWKWGGQITRIKWNSLSCQGPFPLLYVRPWFRYFLEFKLRSLPHCREEDIAKNVSSIRTIYPTLHTVPLARLRLTKCATGCHRRSFLPVISSTHEVPHKYTYAFVNLV